MRKANLNLNFLPVPGGRATSRYENLGLLLPSRARYREPGLYLNPSTASCCVEVLGD